MELLNLLFKDIHEVLMRLEIKKRVINNYSSTLNVLILYHFYFFWKSICLWRWPTCRRTRAAIVSILRIMPFFIGFVNRNLYRFGLMLWVRKIWVRKRWFLKVDMMIFIWMEWIRSQVIPQRIYLQAHNIVSSSIFYLMTFLNIFPPKGLLFASSQPAISQVFSNLTFSGWCYL